MVGVSITRNIDINKPLAEEWIITSKLPTLTYVSNGCMRVSWVLAAVLSGFRSQMAAMRAAPSPLGDWGGIEVEEIEVLHPPGDGCGVYEEVHERDIGFPEKGN